MVVGVWAAVAAGSGRSRCGESVLVVRAGVRPSEPADGRRLALDGGEVQRLAGRASKTCAFWRSADADGSLLRGRSGSRIALIADNDAADRGLP